VLSSARGGAQIGKHFRFARRAIPKSRSRPLWLERLSRGRTPSHGCPDPTERESSSARNAAKGPKPPSCLPTSNLAAVAPCLSRPFLAAAPAGSFAPARSARDASAADVFEKSAIKRRHTAENHFSFDGPISGPKRSRERTGSWSLLCDLPNLFADAGDCLLG
jgi:hypothetical protein